MTEGGDRVVETAGGGVLTIWVGLEVLSEGNLEGLACSALEASDVGA